MAWHRRAAVEAFRRSIGEHFVVWNFGGSMSSEALAKIQGLAAFYAFSLTCSHA
jgi:hypothetical protein